MHYWIENGSHNKGDSRKKTMVISITSGKGGVGKTLSAINLAVAARSLGKTVLIFDGDYGLANVDIVLGLKTVKNISEVLKEEVSIEDIIVPGPLGIDVIPSGSGLSDLSVLSQAQRTYIVRALGGIGQFYDLLVFDTGAGISPNVMHLNNIADEIMVVTNSEPHAMTDAYAMIKVINQNVPEKRIHVLPNMVRSQEEGLIIYRKISEVARRFLEKDTDYIGSIPIDPQIQQAVRMKKAASEATTHTIAGQAWLQASEKLFNKCTPKLGLEDLFLALSEQPSSLKVS